MTTTIIAPGYTHQHITEREVAHQSPCGLDDSAWEDCTFVSGLEWFRATGHTEVPASHAEAEALRCAAGIPPTGGSSITDLRRGIATKYDIIGEGLGIKKAATKLRLSPGEVAVVQGLYGALPLHYRRHDPGFKGGHAAVIFYDSLTTVWWCDPLAPLQNYTGEIMTNADLDKFTAGFSGAQALVGTIRSDIMQPLPITDPTLATIDVKVGAQLYLPDGAPKVKASNVNDAVSPFATKIGTVDYRALYASVSGIRQLLLAKIVDCSDIRHVPIGSDTKHAVSLMVDGVTKAAIEV